MASNVQKTAIARTLDQFAERKVRGALSMLGQNLPATAVSVSRGIVTVKFELQNIPFTLPNVSVPIMGSEFVRLPIQAGTPGMVMTADAYLGGMSGQGGGVADLSPRANLSMLVWTPLGNTNWVAPIDPNALEGYGPNGVILRSTDGTVILKVTKAESSWTPPVGQPIKLNGNVIVSGNLQISGAIQSVTGGTYAGNIQTTGNVIAGVGGADQVGLQTHTHPQSGGGTTSPPTPGS